MHGAADHLAVLGEDGLHVRLGDQQGVEVANEDAGVEGVGVRLVGDVAAGHGAGVGEGGGGRSEKTERKETEDLSHVLDVKING